MWEREKMLRLWCECLCVGMHKCVCVVNVCVFVDCEK